jgi:hypothetical protein
VAFFFAFSTEVVEAADVECERPLVTLRRASHKTMPGQSRWPAPVLLPDDLDDTDAPDALVCPITQELMTEPVLVTTNGRTYQREAITRWVREHGTDPLQRSERLSEGDLAPNLAVRQMVEAWAREKCGGRLPPQPTEPGPVRVAPAPSRQAPAPAPAPAPRAPSPPPPAAIPPLTNLPDEADALETGCLRVLGVWHRPGQPADGKFFRFDAARLGGMLVSRFGEAYFRSLFAEGALSAGASLPLANFTGSGAANRDEARGHVKNGGGAVLRCVNRRSGKADAVLLFDVASGEDVAAGGVGCWNPADYAAADDFRPGDVLLFPDLVVSNSNGSHGSENQFGSMEDAARFPALVPSSVAANTGTGWNLPGRDARFGRCGLVGDWWRALELEFLFDTDTLVAGVYPDAPTAETPLEVAVLRGDADAGDASAWEKIETRAVGAARVFAAAPVSCRRVRARWETTDLHKLGGLSTARSGGGVHAHPLGPPPEARGAAGAGAGPGDVVAAAASIDDGDSDGWWSPRAAAATEISRAAAASLAETDEEARYPQI